MAALQPCLLVAACAALALVAGGGVSAYYDADSAPNYPLPLLERVVGGAPSLADQETASRLLPRLAHKYLRPPLAGSDWLDVPDPRLYLLTDNDVDDAAAQQLGGARAKRTGLGGGPSLSIVNPLDVLRQRLLLEIARRRMRQSEEKIEANRQFLKTIGKRSAPEGRNGEADGGDGGEAKGDGPRWSKDS